MLQRTSKSRNFFRKLVVNGVNSSKAAIQNDCLMRLYDADAELKAISSELDSFDGKKDPIRCNLLVNQLRTAQDKVISLLFQLMDDCNCERASRDYRMKFPDEILLSEGSESLNGQIWFGAECLSAGSNILNHTKESTMLRPMAKTLTTHLDSLRNDLRDLVIDGGGASRINQALIKKMVAFDHIFATFEYEYVRTMLPIRTVAEIEKLQEVAVLFSETLIDSVKRGLIQQEDIDEFQPIVMIAIPRLAIVRGLLYKNENPIYTRHKSQMCSLFQPFHGPLHSIRRLLRGLRPHELFSLEKMLANDQTAIEDPLARPKQEVPVHKSSQPDVSMQSTDDQQSCACQGEGEPGTSNNYSHALMDGLQYPVGQKTGIQSSGPGYFQPNVDLGEQQDYGCCFETPSSSSKAVVDTTQSLPNNSPVGSSSSSSSSSSLSSSIECKDCIKKVEENVDDQQEEQEDPHHDCDKNCCISPPDNDSQLERLIAEFGPSMDSSLEPSAAIADSPITTTTITSSSSQQLTSAQNEASQVSETIEHQEQQTPTSTYNVRQTKLEKPPNDDAALIEELIVKQAQQLLHRLFVAISGVADQLQSNFASDLRFILRHIFSSEIEGSNEGDEDDVRNDDDDDDADSDNRGYSNNEHSDSSLPIEQGIEAQEVANLIDLGSGYSLNSPYDYESDIRCPPQVSGSFPYSNSTQPTNDNRTNYSPGHSSLYASVAQQPTDPELTITNNSRAFQDNTSSSHDAVTDEVLADLMRAADQAELMFDPRSSPNEPSIMDDVRRRQQLIQQHLQSMPRASHRTSSSSASRIHRQLNGTGGVGSDGSAVHSNVERRFRHHHGGSRSRRQRGPPVWVPDQLVVACSCCNVSFTLFKRRHHCRACGQIFCADCSKFTKNLNCWGYNGPVRVCESCYNQP